MRRTPARIVSDAAYRRAARSSCACMLLRGFSLARLFNTYIPPVLRRRVRGRRKAASAFPAHLCPELAFTLTGSERELAKSNARAARLEIIVACQKKSQRLELALPVNDEPTETRS